MNSFRARQQRGTRLDRPQSNVVTMLYITFAVLSALARRVDGTSASTALVWIASPSWWMAKRCPSRQVYISSLQNLSTHRRKGVFDSAGSSFSRAWLRPLFESACLRLCISCWVTGFSNPFLQRVTLNPRHSCGSNLYAALEK